MELRINNGKNSYLYCSVHLNPTDYQSIYSSANECMEDITPDIIADANKRGYTKDETDTIIQHYSICIGNASGEWINTLNN